MGLSKEQADALFNKPAVKARNPGIVVTPTPGLPPKYPVANDSPAKAHKFKVSKKADRTTDGITFDSKLEMHVWQHLRQAGYEPERQITFELQPKFELDGVKYRAITYVADFRLKIAGREYVLDAKGFRTPDYVMKLKMMAFVHRIGIIEIKSVKKLKEFLERAQQGFVSKQKVIAPISDKAIPI